MISKIELNQIEWITNGERASSLNMNRPMKQFLTKYNISIDEINDAFDNFQPDLTPILTKVIDKTDDEIGLDSLGKYNIRDLSTTVAAGLPIGFNFHIVADGSDISIFLSGETILSTNEDSCLLENGSIAKFVKLDELRWIVTIEQSVQ